MLINIIILQVLGHSNFNKKAQRENYMNSLSMNEVKINSDLSHQSHIKSFPNMQILDFHVIPSPNLYPKHQLIIPGSNLFRAGYLDGGTLRLDTCYSWRREEEKVAR